MKKTVVGLVGCGGFGREVMPALISSTCVSKQDTTVTEYVFVDNEESVGRNVNGFKVLNEIDFFDMEAAEKLFNVAIGNSVIRKQVALRFLEKGCKPISVIAPSVIIYDQNEISEGAVICDNCIITANAKIGKFFQSNIYSYVAHDCEIGDFVTFAPRVSCNGNVRIEDFAYIGTGAVIKQGSLSNPLVVGEGAIIGMGAVVTKSVAPYTTVVGNPAKPFVKK